MSADKLASTFKRELLRNKKKSAILAVMCLVALYFWAPLVWGWLAPEGDEAALGEVVAIEEVAPSAVSTVVEAPSRAARRRETPWQDLLKAIEEDERMTSATLSAVTRSPFLPAAGEAPDPGAESAPQQPETVASLAGLADLAGGLELTGIVYGPRLRIATIDGVEYRENDQIQIELSALPAGLVGNVGESPDFAESNVEIVESDTAVGNSDDDSLVETATLPPNATVAASVAKLEAIVATIRPKSVELRFSDGSTKVLTLSGAALSGQDVIRITRTRPPR